MLGLDGAAACFGGWITGASTCRKEIVESFTPYVLRSIVFSPLRLDLESRGYLSNGVTGRHRAKNLTARNSAERLVAGVI